MSAPSPGSGGSEDRAMLEATQHPPEQGPESVLTNELPFVDVELPDALNEEGERVTFMRKLQIWTISEARLTRCPADFKDLEKRKTYTSFGDNGTTATVSAYGHILQICRYFGVGRSGFFCVDLPDIIRAWISDARLRSLLHRAQSNVATIGINWKEAFGDSWDFDDLLPCLEFVDDRWPRFTSPDPDQNIDQKARRSQNQGPKLNTRRSRKLNNTSGLSVDSSYSVQFFCHSGTIFQRCTLQRSAGIARDSQLSQLKLDTDLLIRNLDFTESLDFNDYLRFSEAAEDSYYSDYFEGSQRSQHPEGSDDSQHPEGSDDSHHTEDVIDYTYAHRLGDERNTLMIVHKIMQTSSEEMGIRDTGHQRAVVLTITPYVNGQLQLLDLKNEVTTINLSEDVQHQVKNFGVLDVVLTYELQLLENDRDMEQSDSRAKGKRKKKPANEPVDPKAMMTKFGSKAEGSYQKVLFSSHPHFDFIIRRNLEHILSVCSIPVARPQLARIEGRRTISTHEKNSPIALTCGDISGHRVGLSASFYALQFLLEMSRYLRNKDSGSLAHRIHKTCERHLAWVLESTDAPEGTDVPNELLAFSPHYWASGQPITDTSYLPEQSLLDTPLQILKIFRRGDLSIQQKARLSKRIVNWLQNLEKKDERKRYAFARTKSAEPKKFHLADHVRISEALTTVTELLSELEDDTTNKLMQGFDRDSVKENILKRFITENPASKQRTIATSRTASETRFLFHSKDTPLLYAMDSGLFSKKESKSDDKHDSWKYLKDEWENTIECQTEHQETQELKWRKPLWYALSFILGSKQRQINKASSEALLDTTGKILLDLPSPSGLFPGFLTRNQVPTAYEEETYRDNYWQTTFEIPYILWRYGRDEMTRFASIDGSRSLGTTEKSQKINNSKTRGGFMKKKHEFANLNRLIDPRGLVEVSDDWLQPGPEALKFGFQSDLVKHPHSKPCDMRIEEAESFPSGSDLVASSAWFTYHKEVESGKFTHSFTDETGEKGLIVDVSRHRVGEESRGRGLENTLLDNQNLANLLCKPRDVKSAKKRLIWLPKADKETALICCLASPPDEQYNLSAFFDRHAIYEKYFSDEASATMNEWNTEIHLSFYRLAQFSDHSDFCVMEGIPEFSYVVPQSQGSQKRAKHKKEIPDIVPGIVRAAMGFRFVGDFFDRYWTCHFLEYVPGNPPPKKKGKSNIIRKGKTARSETNNNCVSSSTPEDLVPDLGPTSIITTDDTAHPKSLQERLPGLGHIPVELSDPHTGKPKYPWQQRKILELLLFHHIVLDVERETREIFSWARDSVLKPSVGTEEGKPRYSGTEAQNSVLRNSESADDVHSYKMAASDPLNPLSEAIDGAYQFVQLGDSEGYFKIIGHWRLFEEILQSLGEDLNENLETISEWSTREKDREPESPRWTRNDEHLFRNTINKLRVQNQRKMRDLERLSTTIQTFRDSLSGRLESIREDMSFRGSENMSLFTYVTVVFLPLGFATGIFSMSDAPGRLTLAFMIATAITSLSITVLALINAKSLRGFFKRQGKPLETLFLFVVYSCLFVVFSVGAVFRPVFRPIFKHTFKPILRFLGKEEHLEHYKKKLSPIQEFDWTKKVHVLGKKEPSHDAEAQNT